MATSGLLDAELWSRFPTDLLLYNVLPRLPLIYRLSLRSVCKYWKHLLVAEPYTQHCLATSPQCASSFITWSSAWPDSLRQLAAGERGFDARCYDHSTDSWQPLTQPLTPPNINPNMYLPLASSGGLLCFEHLLLSTRKKPSLAVCNPILHQWLELPPLPSSSTPFNRNSVCLSPKEGPGGFFLVLVCLSCPFVFDSSSRLWKDIPVHILFPDDCYRLFKVIVIGTIAYILASEYGVNDHGHWARPVLIKYDLISTQISKCHSPLDEMWQGVSISRLLKIEWWHKLCPQLFEFNGKVLVVGLNNRFELCFWVMDVLGWRLLKTVQCPHWDHKLSWSRMSFSRVPEFHTEDNNWFNLSHSGVSNFDITKDYNLFYFHDILHCDAFDMERNEWKRLDEDRGCCPKTNHRRAVISFKWTNHHLLDATR